MRAVYDRRRKLMVELMREMGFDIPVMPQGAFYVFADASRWTDDAFAFELLEKAGVGVAPGVDFGQMGSRQARSLGLAHPHADDPTLTFPQCTNPNCENDVSTSDKATIG